MEVLSKFESENSKSESGSSEPVRPLHLPRAAVKPPEIMSPPRPPEVSAAANDRAVKAAEGVLLFSRQAAEQAQAAKAATERIKVGEDDDDDEQEQRPRAQATGAADQPATPIESNAKLPQTESSETPVSLLTPEGSAAEVVEPEELPGAIPFPPTTPPPARPVIPKPRQEAFVYPESSAEATVQIPVAEQSIIGAAQAAESASGPRSSELLPEPPLESYAPEPLPPIAGETNALYEDEAEEPSTPTATRPLRTTPMAATPVWAPGPSHGTNKPNTPANSPPPGHTGPGGGGPPLPPSMGPNLYPGGPGGPGNPNLPPSGPGSSPNFAPRPAAPNLAPGVNANISLGLSNNRVRAADWPARLIGLAGFVSSRRTRRKLGKRIDKVEAGNKRSQEDILTRQRRFESQQRQHNTEIGRLQTEQQRLAHERQRLQAEALPPIPPVGNVEQQQKQEELLKQQGLELQPNQHVEHSAWHSIVVNEHGKAVQDAMQYGEGFRRERQHEAIQDQTGAMAGAGAAMDGSGTSGAGAGIGATQGLGSFDGTTPTSQQPYAPMPTTPQPMPPYQRNLSSGMTSQALPPGLPNHTDAQHQLPAQAEDKRPVSGMAFWIMLLIIVAAFFVAALI